MASMQCHRPNEPCQQRCHKPAIASSNHSQQYYSSSSQVPGMAGFMNGGGHSGQHYMHGHGQVQPHSPHTNSSTTSCYSQTVTYKASDHQGLGGPMHHHGGSTTTTAAGGANGVMPWGCNGGRKTRRGDRHMRKERDGRNLFQKIKDKVSGDISCSSESDSDNEGNCRIYKY